MPAPTFTSRLGLRKPDPDPVTGDFVDVQADLNANMDKIDAALGAIPCTSSARPSNPYIGQMARETDTGNLIVCISTGPVVWEVFSNPSFFKAWTNYTPTWATSGTAPSLGNGILTGRFKQVGKMVLYTILFTAGSTTTFGTGAWSFSTPTSRLGSVTESAMTTLRDITAANAFTGGGRHSGSTVQLNSASGLVTSTVPFAWGASDIVNLSGFYESS